MHGHFGGGHACSMAGATTVAWAVRRLAWLDRVPVGWAPVPDVWRTAHTDDSAHYRGSPVVSIFTPFVAAGVALVGYLACALVIVHLRRVLRQARDQATHDPLTTLPNGAKAQEVFGRALRQGQPVS